MWSYSELTPAQKRVVDLLRTGKNRGVPDVRTIKALMKKGVVLMGQELNTKDEVPAKEK